MLICGSELTHDGGGSLLDGGRMVRSGELEKLADNLRHQRVDGVEIVEQPHRLVLWCCGRTPSAARDVAVLLRTVRAEGFVPVPVVPDVGRRAWPSGPHITTNNREQQEGP
ncbi:hypothetical protein [Streptomyces sp. GbtcB6]|uniref:hypothetical protein n=1 Tax=Streptomyces sp. GbtcB6 TaxID=2824751 RepID=UPI001C304ECC|nr:hypothetical protein [Streptomyces sp. GbtcB6]